jgi:hypothetical protein
VQRDHRFLKRVLDVRMRAPEDASNDLQHGWPGRDQ